MINIFCYVRYSTAHISLDKQFIFCALIFLLLCGLLFIQNLIWEEDYFARNKKLIDWRASAIKKNRGDLSKIYPNK